MPPAPTERVLLPPARAVAAPVLLSAPFAFGTEGTDMLRVRLWCVAPRGWLASGRTFDIVIRSVTPEGRGQLTIERLIPTTDLVVTTKFLPLAAGALQTVSITWSGVGLTVIPGMCYGIVDLVRGTPTGAQAAIGTFLSGYLGPGLAMTWPGAPLVGPQSGPGYQKKIATVGVLGNEVAAPDAAGEVWRLRSVFSEFLASGAAVNRRSHLVVTTVASQLGLWPSQAEVGPLVQLWTTWMPGAALGVGHADLSGVAPMPDGLIIRSGDLISTQTLGLQGGDQYTRFVVNVDSWIDPL